MQAVISKIFEFGPLVFAVGFLVPLMSQLIQAAGWTPPFGLTPLQTGFILGGAFGLLAQVRGRWV